MREMIKLFVVVALFSAVAGGLLATVRNATQDQIENQQLIFVKGPTVARIMEGCSNNPLEDRFKISDGEREIAFFVAEFDGKRNTIAFETFGKGFGGDVGVMVAVNLESDEIVGIGVTTHSETPGLGSRAKSDLTFSAQFKGMSIKEPFKVKPDGGKIDALSGATVTSRGVCAAVSDSSEIYKRLKDKILKQVKA
ncbi:MAG: RnfABCDGE type electron transport complex subunit G [Deltaproteobacteria bacterium]|nr:RnfABCDGE type electron transport complex subunit G [Deltaproteobacteria bacterium]MBW1911723.1 RnfABCDGE type electron transport complex subunit G [Deltaproteobacteria bacterium]